MRIFYLVIIVFISSTAYSQINQTDARGMRQGKWQKNYPNGRPMYEGNFKDDKPAGEWIRYYEGGVVKAKIQYHEDSDTASAVLFDQLGKKIAEGSYLNEKRTGKWQFFIENRKVSEEQYDNGKKQGISRTFYPTGEVLEEVEWEDGRQHGSYKVFFKNGNPYLQCKYYNNKRNGLCLSYFQNGRLEMEAYYQDNLRHNSWKFYDENGQVKYTLEYDRGNLLNPDVEDSINNLNRSQFEKSSSPVTDPEDFMRNPSEYMMRMQNIR